MSMPTPVTGRHADGATGRRTVLTVRDLDVVYEVTPPVHAVKHADLELHAGRSSGSPGSPAAARRPWRTRSTGCTSRRRGSRRAR